MYNLFQLKKNYCILKFLHQLKFSSIKNNFVTICKYVNFNNLRKKKGFVGGDVMVR